MSGGSGQSKILKMLGSDMSLKARVLIQDEDREENQCLVYMDRMTFSITVDGYIMLDITAMDGATIVKAIRDQQSCAIPIWKDNIKHTIESVTDVLTRARMTELLHEGIKYTSLHSIVSLN